MGRDDTIFALATAPGKAAVAIVRLSGDKSRLAVEALGGPVGEARRMVVRRLCIDGEILDEALVVWFEANASFTGEESAELHLHGGRAVVKGVLDALSGVEGLRVADAGEFTRRALDNGRLDLAQVEGLADLIDAQTEAQRRVAMALADGRFSHEIQSLKRDAVSALALIEASIDFADEDDAPVDVTDDVQGLLEKMVARLTEIERGSKTADNLREGYRVALIGVPNVGKSSLINAIAGRDVAITSDIAGTTRDTIEVLCDLQGLPVTFVDTAGMRRTDDAVEAIGVERAAKAASTADLRLVLQTFDAPAPDLCPARPGDIEVWTKTDRYPSEHALAVSAFSGEGIEALLSTVFETLSERVVSSGVSAHARQTERVRAAKSALEGALAADGLELMSFEVREAMSALDEIVGVVNTEDVLSEIFSRFCMGK